MKGIRNPLRVGALMLTLALVAAFSAACSSNGKPSGDSTTPPAGTTGGNTAPTTMTSINVGLPPLAKFAPIYLGIKKGFFKNHGLDVTLKPGVAGSAGVTAAVGGSVQFVVGSLSTVFVATEKGFDLKVIAATDQSGSAPNEGALVVKKDGPIKTVNDLAGKTVAINQVQSVDYVLDVESLLNAGATDATIKSIKWVPVDFPEMPSALEGGRVDAITTQEPFATQVLSKGDARVLVPTHNVNGTQDDLVIGTWLTTGKYAAANPDIVKQFQEAITESMNYATAHVDEARAMLSTFTKMSPQLIKTVSLPPWNPQISKASYDWYATELVKYGVVKSAPPASSVVIGTLS